MFIHWTTHEYIIEVGHLQSTLNKYTIILCNEWVLNQEKCERKLDKEGCERKLDNEECEGRLDNEGWFREYEFETFWRSRNLNL